MSKKKFIVATVVALSASMMLQSCIGSFALFNKVKAWNSQVDNKFVNEVVFVAMWILPVYELSLFADLLILNSIEFWSGSNPVVAQTKVVDGKDAQYLVASNEDGYVITNMKTKEVTEEVDNSIDIKTNELLHTANVHYKLSNGSTSIEMAGSNASFSAGAELFLQATTNMTISAMGTVNMGAMTILMN